MSDDLTERLTETANRVFATRGRSRGGACGQTVEATSRATLHEISAWDAEIMHEAAAEITALRADRDRLRTTLIECAEDLEGYVTAEVGLGGFYNKTVDDLSATARRRYERNMRPVYAAHTALDQSMETSK